MSSEAPFGLVIMEKLVGLIMIVIGAITFYVVYTNLSSPPIPAPFLGASVVLAILGLILVLAKTGE